MKPSFSLRQPYNFSPHPFFNYPKYISFSLYAGTLLLLLYENALCDDVSVTWQSDLTTAGLYNSNKIRQS
jgi:hypothetical protein